MITELQLSFNGIIQIEGILAAVKAALEIISRACKPKKISEFLTYPFKAFLTIDEVLDNLSRSEQNSLRTSPLSMILFRMMIKATRACLLRLTS